MHHPGVQVSDMQVGSVRVNGVDLAYIEDGPRQGALALCLHGFPDTAHTWRHLLPDIAARGYHAVAPWMRGYSPSDVPADGCYQTGALASDACALHEAMGADGDAVLIGHDWGALAAYGAAAYQADRWRRVVALAVPPPSTMIATFLSYEQVKRSFYMFFFQSPLAEMAVGMDNYCFLDKLWADWSPGYNASADLELVKQAIGSPVNIHAAIGYYRAMFDPSLHDPLYAPAQSSSGSVPTQPTLYLHGANDGCIGAEVTRGLLEQLPSGSQCELVENAGHFLHLERPGLVSSRILSFVTS